MKLFFTKLLNKQWVVKPRCLSSFFCHQRQRGVGLIEVLIALFILGIGLLGVLSMQTLGINTNQRAMFASEVNALSADMVDRILAFGIDGADAGEFKGLVTSPFNAADGAGASTVIQSHGVQWAAVIAGSTLPNATGSVDWNAVTATYTVTLRWDSERSGAVGTVCPSNARDANGFLVNLTCFQLTVAL